jgi:hypothetical protein
VPAGSAGLVLSSMSGATLRNQPIRVRAATTQDIPAGRPPRRPTARVPYKPSPKGKAPFKKHSAKKPKRPK